MYLQEGDDEGTDLHITMVVIVINSFVAACVHVPAQKSVAALLYVSTPRLTHARPHTLLASD